jgi:hypothetical protein
MPSPEASRANGRKSRGPITTQGKINSSRNSRRHGVYAKSIVVDPATQARYQAVLAAFTQQFHPTTPLEIRLVATLALTHTRRRELWALEKNLINAEIHRTAQVPPDQAELPRDPFFALVERGQLFDRIQTEESSCNRRFLHALRDLAKLQSTRAQPNSVFSGTNLTSDTKQSTGLRSEPGTRFSRVAIPLHLD